MKVDTPAQSTDRREVMPARSGGGQPDARPVYTVREAAEQLTLSLNSTYELVRQGVIPHRRLGRRIVVPRKALEDFLNADSREG